MSFSPQFLDELRARISLAQVVGRRVNLTKRGREYVGLCPFHKEKTPSFHVVEDKGFFHCFGCGAHGDVIGFTMQQGNLGFREAIEALAGEAGLELPRDTPQERERAQRQVELHDALEAAASFFHESLWRREGAPGLAYLRQRGLDDTTIRRFRLGFAPEGGDALKRALGATVPEPLLHEGGLLRRRDDGSSYDYFRNRVIFPIGDRADRIIAFGGRVIGEGQPKYLNSPETAVFQKGRVLYGWAAARAAAGKDNSAIVTEGYMDVIALQRAGFGTAVAPLGTALTEAQIEELWKMAPEPVLCFDGDSAGQRAALRAADRALPMLRPGFSLRFAELPTGEDPDTLILHQGVEAMRAILASARPLGEVVWAAERRSATIDTPERRAALEQRLESRVKAIAERSVAEQYRHFFRDKMYGAFGGKRRPMGRGSARSGGGARRFEPPLDLTPPENPDPRGQMSRRLQQIMFTAILNHPALLHEFTEEFAHLERLSPELDKLRREIINVSAVRPDLDAAALRLHLCQVGFDRVVDGLLSPQVYVHGAFARPDADLETVRSGWLHARRVFHELPHLAADLARAGVELGQEMTEARLAPFSALRDQREAEDRTLGGPEGGGAEETGGELH